jgi:predicted DNA-binding protein (UPF0251 family)
VSAQMNRTPARHVIGDGRWRDANLPYKIAAALALRDIVNIWFDGSQQRACQALGVSRAVLWRQMTGRDVVSRPMVRRMLLLTADEKERSRRAREALEAADREAEIVLVRHAIDKLATAKAVQASGNSGGAVRK